MPRNWFTEDNTPDLGKADRNVLNRAAQCTFHAGYQPSQRELDLLKNTYHPGMKAVDLLREVTLEVELIRQNSCC